MSAIELLERVQLHLENIEQKKVKLLDNDLLDKAISRVSIDRLALEKPEGKQALMAVLLVIVNLLKDSELEIEFYKIIELVDELLYNLTYEEVVSIVKYDTLLQALKSESANLQLLAIKVSSTANPPDLVSNTEIIPRYIELLSISQTPVRVVNEIEKSLNILVKGELVRRRILSKSELDVIRGMTKGDVLIKSRALSIFTILLPFASQDEIYYNLSPLFPLFNFEDTDKDEVYLLTLIQFLTEITSMIDGSIEDRSWLLSNIGISLDSVTKAVKSGKFSFIHGSAVELFSKLSFVARSTFKELDKNFLDLGHSKDVLLLSSVNPEYLAEEHSALLKRLRISFNAVTIFRNLIENEKSFNIIKESIASKDLLSLPYLEFIAIVVKLTEYSYGSQYLLKHLPQVMNKLLSGDGISEPQCYKIRKITLENLRNLPDEVLDIWRGGVYQEYSLLVNGRRSIPQVTVFDRTL
ncbi:hypothetical protein WICMUC_004353 [Wickerhamomyces mucosus]|uniref:DNA mismatch repair protein HSM3 n=1 Tax=Wickerhamomyces mucosus TaxID=1378264 RepID=A0A9P8TAB7_9ASCO|nr:hypothetical protein WICMUC_004353 [Wickerhamomyces mucosus]